MSKIYVGNLPFNITEQELDSSFQQFGKIKEIALIKDRYTNECKGFAFITFDAADSAQKALTLNGTDFQGRPMKVSKAVAKADDRRSSSSYRDDKRGHGGYGSRNTGRGRW